MTFTGDYEFFSEVEDARQEAYEMTDMDFDEYDEVDEVSAKLREFGFDDDDDLTDEDWDDDDEEDWDD